jgi:hypothetical protein
VEESPCLVGQCLRCQSPLFCGLIGNNHFPCESLPYLRAAGGGMAVFAGDIINGGCASLLLALCEYQLLSLLA